MNWRALAWMLAGGLLGLALSATLWLTAAFELDTVWMGFKDIQTSGYFDYSGHFRALLPRGSELGLIQPRFLFRYEVAGDALSGDGTPFAMGAVQAALVLAALIVCGASLICSSPASDRQPGRRAARNRARCLSRGRRDRPAALLGLGVCREHVHDHPGFAFSVGSRAGAADRAVSVALSFCAGLFWGAAGGHVGAAAAAPVVGGAGRNRALDCGGGGRAAARVSADRRE